MSLYNFDSDLTLKDPDGKKNFPFGMNEYPGVKQLDHSEPRSKIDNGDYEVYPYNRIEPHRDVSPSCLNKDKFGF